MTYPSDIHRIDSGWITVFASWFDCWYHYSEVNHYSEMNRIWSIRLRLSQLDQEFCIASCNLLDKNLFTYQVVTLTFNFKVVTLILFWLFRFSRSNCSWRYNFLRKTVFLSLKICNYFVKVTDPQLCIHICVCVCVCNLFE